MVETAEVLVVSCEFFCLFRVGGKYFRRAAEGRRMLGLTSALAWNASGPKDFKKRKGLESDSRPKPPRV